MRCSNAELLHSQGAIMHISQRTLQVLWPALWPMTAVQWAALIAWPTLPCRLSLLAAQRRDCEGAPCLARSVKSSSSDTLSSWTHGKWGLCEQSTLGSQSTVLWLLSEGKWTEVWYPGRNSYGSHLTLVIPGLFFSETSHFFGFGRTILNIYAFIISTWKARTLPVKTEYVYMALDM